MDLQKPATIRRLPFMRNFEDAEAFFKKDHDPFHLAAFLIQCWLGGLVIRAAGQYAENKNPKDRELQTGESWRSLVELFSLKPEKPSQYLLSCLFRFSALDDSPGNSLRHALVPLTIEHRITGNYFAPATQNSELSTKNSQPDTTLIRWCDWLDADIHLRTHRRWHESPACFDPDPETRHLAALGNAQRHLSKLDDRAKACWLADFAAAAEHYQNSPKWHALGKAMADNSDRQWHYPDVDTLVIALWPLVKAYNWTYRDLLNVIRPGLSRRSPAKAEPNSTPHFALRTMHSSKAEPNPTLNSALSTPHFSYPLARDQDFATYCVSVLGLRKTAKGLTPRSGRPPGYDIARQFCPTLALTPS